MKEKFTKLLPHLAVVFLFGIVALIYFHPVLQGKQIYQSDIVQYIGMAKEQNDFRRDTGKEPYWTNSAFGGMPTYQLGANYPHNYVKKLDKLIRFLPRPADYLFLYFVGIYILLLVLKIDYKIAFIGALAFGFSTYLIIILGVGHNAKAHAIGYFPLVISGILLAFRKKYIWGFLLTALAMALELNANHFQMTYYLMLLVGILGVVYLIYFFKQKQLLHFAKASGILLIAVGLSIILNATGLMATKEYAEWSTRGISELTKDPDGNPKVSSNGLSKDYITEYSYGISESLNLFVPRLFGGGNSENLGEDSHTYQFMVKQGYPSAKAKEFSENLPTYWGDQPIVAAPAYIGAVVLFLFVLGLFFVKGKHKWWLVTGVIVSLILSWGKNFSMLTDFMIESIPLYNKFRAVSSIQVILELCVPILASIALYQFIKSEDTKKKQKAIKYASLVLLGLGAVLFFFSGSFSFEGINDAYYRKAYFGDAIMDTIVKDRKAIFNADIFRSVIYVLLTAIVLFAMTKQKIKINTALVLIAVLILADLTGVARRYVNNDDFVQARKMEKPFSTNPADQQILKDNTVFRVYDPSDGMAGARAAYYHKSIGGYHAAKPRRFQELYDYQISKNNISIFNMLNVKYIIQQDENGKKYAGKNPFVNGNAWFVNTIVKTKNPDESIQALSTLESATEVVLQQDEVSEEILNTVLVKDSTASISLTNYQPNKLVYESNSKNKGIAVFSEMYYPYGWNAYMDGELTNHFRVNYVLRAMLVPAGKHTIEFKFEPKVVHIGSGITLAGTLIFVLLFLGGIYYEFSYKRKEIVVVDSK
ncbi:YfhO family protein [Ascidiimonas sp. W6]|uniref:YfhO family protein n=1 Tax=Ascidiimonas meishanensis TaxID=3128903 RepID=UPI0030EE0610